MNVIIKKNDKTNKKNMAIIDNKKKNIGAKIYEDYTTHKNHTRKKAYLARHKHDNYTNPLYPSFYATNLLWNKPTLKDSIKNTNEKYNINIKLKY